MPNPFRLLLVATATLLACTAEPTTPSPAMPPCDSSASGGIGLPPSFSYVATAAPFTYPFQRLFAMADAEVGYALEGGILDMPTQLFRTTDGGISWEVLPGAPAGTPLFFRWFDAQRGWLATHQPRDNRTRISRTTDGGLTWTHEEPLELVGGQLLEVIAAPDGMLFGLFFQVDRYVVVRSDDDGQGWERIYSTTGLRHVSGARYSLRYHAGVLYVPATASSVRCIRPDGSPLPGLTVSTAPGVGRPLLIDDTAWLVATDEGIRRSLDQGLTWTTVSDRSVFPLYQRGRELWVAAPLSCPDPNGPSGVERLVLGYSADSGTSWAFGPVSAASLWHFRLDGIGPGRFVATTLHLSYRLETR